MPGSFTADWAANLWVEQPGTFTFEIVTSGPTILLVDDRTVIETSEFEQDAPRSGSIALSAGSHRIVIRYLKKGLLSTIWLLWQPPSGQLFPIPIRLLRPLSRDEYLGLRGRLPLPHAE